MIHDISDRAHVESTSVESTTGAVVADAATIGKPFAKRQRAHSTRTTHTANYLLGMPLISDYLEDGLSLSGLSREDFEINRL